MLRKLLLKTCALATLLATQVPDALAQYTLRISNSVTASSFLMSYAGYAQPTSLSIWNGNTDVTGDGSNYRFYVNGGGALSPTSATGSSAAYGKWLYQPGNTKTNASVYGKGFTVSVTDLSGNLLAQHNIDIYPMDVEAGAILGPSVMSGNTAVSHDLSNMWMPGATDITWAFSYGSADIVGGQGTGNATVRSKDYYPMDQNFVLYSYFNPLGSPNGGTSYYNPYGKIVIHGRNPIASTNTTNLCGGGSATLSVDIVGEAMVAGKPPYHSEGFYYTPLFTYQWYKSGAPVSGATNQTFTTNVVGTYNVGVTQYNWNGTTNAYNTTAAVTKYSNNITLSAPANAVANTFYLNGQAPAFPTDTPKLVMCDGGTFMYMNAPFTGVTTYVVTIAGGFGRGWSSGPIASSGGTLSVDLTTTGLAGTFPYLLGPIQVTVTGIGPCNTVSTTEMFNVIRANSITAFDFNVNGQTPSGTVPAPTVWLCNSSSKLLIGAFPLVGTATSFDIEVTKGSYSGGVFTATFLPESITIPSLPSSLDSLFSTYLSGYTGYIKVVVGANGPCNSRAPIEKIFNIQTATAAVDFLMIAPTDYNLSASPCTNPTDPTLDGTQPLLANRRDLWNPALIPAQPQSSPTCTLGWLGAYSVGIIKAKKTGTATTDTSVSPLPYNVRVDMVDTGDVVLANIVNRSVLSITAANFAFNQRSTPPNYFTNNYHQNAQIQNSAIFKVTLTMATRECGSIKQFSYFKILDGGPAGGPNYPDSWRLAPENASLERINIFPNPATDEVHATWHSEKNGNATLILMDVLGKVVLQKDMNAMEGSNDVIVNLSSVVPGIYHYMLQTENNKYTGKIVKQ